MNPKPPLTHHDILALAEPLVRAGKAVDLAASDRQQRRIAFRPVERPARAAEAGHDGLPALVETWQLEDGVGQDDASLRLTRTWTTPGGLQARAIAEGPDAAALLVRIEALPATSQVFRQPGDAIVALTHLLTENGTALRAAQARVSGLALEMEVSRVPGYPAELALRWLGDGAPQWPLDLLSVLGRPWDRLRHAPGAWLANLQLSSREPRRSADAQERLLRTVAHLATTLSEPPARFHERHGRARWGVALRDTAPLLTGLAVVATALYVQRQGSGAEPILALLANAAPPILMLLFFLRREMPRLELPRVPRRPRRDAWLPVVPGGAGAVPEAASPLSSPLASPQTPPADTRCLPTP